MLLWNVIELLSFLGEPEQALYTSVLNVEFCLYGTYIGMYIEAGHLYHRPFFHHMHLLSDLQPPFPC